MIITLHSAVLVLASGMLIADEVHKLPLHVIWLNFYFGLKFSNQFNFCFPLSQIMIVNQKQKKNKNSTGLKFLNPKN